MSFLLPTSTLLRPIIPTSRKQITHQRRPITLSQLEAAQASRERIVILGSGWAGYNLARSLNPKKFQTVLISPRSYFVFTPLLASTSVGTLEFRTALEPVRSRQGRKKYEYIQGRADAVDFGKKKLSIRETVRDPNLGLMRGGERDDRPMEMRIEASRGELFELKYDKLVVAVGSYSQTFGIPGVKENAFFLKDVQDARKIRNKLLSCFETAALPTTPVALKKQLLNFAVVGGGPTGIEFSGELQDIVKDDMSRLYPQLMEHVQITVYDVADKILPMFDDELGKYAVEHFVREGVTIRTSHRILELSRGFPKDDGSGHLEDVKASGFTLKLQNGEASEVGCGLVVWSTGLMSNPFIQKTVNTPFDAPPSCVQMLSDSHSNLESCANWRVQKHARTGGVLTDEHLRVQLIAADHHEDKPAAILQDVFALGDCATIADGSEYPATAQVASQKAKWLAKKLNKGDVDTRGFSFASQGIMAYVGAYKAIVQLNKGSLSGRTAWLMWRGAYLSKSISWRNRLLIPMYWFINWAFGRDISRF